MTMSAAPVGSAATQHQAPATATATASAPAQASAPVQGQQGQAPVSQHAAQTAPSPTVAHQQTRPPQGGEEVPGTPWWHHMIAVLVGLLLLLGVLVVGRLAYNLYFPAQAATAPTQQQPAATQPAPAPGTTVVTPGTTQVAPGTTTVTPGTVQQVPAQAAPGTTQVAPGTTVVTPGTTQVAPGTTIVTQGTTQVAPPPAGQPIYAVDPVLLGKFATSSVESTDATLVTVRKHKDNDEVIFVGPGKHLPRKIIVASCPQIAPIQVNVPVPSVENKIYIPQPPVPPTAPVAPVQPSAPVAPQVQQQTSVPVAVQTPVPVAVGQPVRRVPSRNHCN